MALALLVVFAGLIAFSSSAACGINCPQGTYYTVCNGVVTNTAHTCPTAFQVMTIDNTGCSVSCSIPSNCGKRDESGSVVEGPAAAQVNPAGCGLGVIYSDPCYYLLAEYDTCAWGAQIIAAKEYLEQSAFRQKA